MPKKKPRALGRLGRTLRLIGRSLVWTLGLALFLAVVGTAVGIAVASRYLTPEWLQSSVAQQLERTFNRPVSVRRVTVVLHQGLRVDGLVVRESPDFPGETFLSSDSLVIRYDLAALLAGRLELSLVRLLSPRIELVRREDGRWNLQDVFKSTPQPQGRIALPPLQFADAIRIERGELRVRDLKKKTELRFSDLRMAFDDFSFEAPFPAEIAFGWDSLIDGRRIDADVAFKGVLSLAGFKRREEAYVAAKRLTVSMGPATADLSGSLRNFAQPRLDLKVQVPRIDSGLLSRFAKVPAGIDVPPSVWRLKMAALPAPEGTSWMERAYQVEQLEGGLEGAFLSARGRVDARTLRMNASLRGFDLERASRYYAAWSGRTLTGTLSGAASVSGPLAKPKVGTLSLDLDGFAVNISSAQGISNAVLSLRTPDGFKTVDLAVKRGTYIGLGHVLYEVSLDARAAKGDLDIRGFSALWNDSRVGFKGCVRGWEAPRQVVGDLSLDKLQTDAFYVSVLETIERRRKAADEPPPPQRPWSQVFKHSIPKKFPDIRGRIRVAEAFSPHFRTQNLELLFDLKSIARGLKDVDGEFRLAFGPGIVSDVQTVRAAHKVLSVLLLPYTYMHEMNAKAVLSPDTATPSTYDFNRQYGDFRVDDGKMDIRFIHSDGPQFLAFADGKVDFASEKLDARVLMRLTKSRGQLPERLVDGQGRPAIELLVKDDLNKPTTELTLRKMGASDIEDALTQSMKKTVPFDPLAGASGCGKIQAAGRP